MGRSQGFEEVFSAAFSHVDFDIDDVAHLDCYSCFPIAVRAQARALGISEIDPTRPLTFTGGMTFAGGPLNNYVLQATVRLAELLREHGGRALSTSVSGMLNKQGAGLWSATPPSTGWAHIDVTEATTAATALIPLDEFATGEATIAAWTVVHRKGDPTQLIAICDTAAGTRAIASTTEAADVTTGTLDDLAGTKATLAADGGLRLSS